MHKLLIVAVVALGLAGFAQAQVLVGTYNSGRDDETDNSSSMDMEFGPCGFDSSLTCGTALRSIAADGSINANGYLEPSENFGNGARFPFAGSVLLRGLKYAGVKGNNQRWEGGLFYNPATGKEFNGVYVEHRPDGKLDVGGCVLFFCQATTFTPL